MQVPEKFNQLPAEITFEQTQSTAKEITDAKTGKVISKGKELPRLKLFGEDKNYFIAIDKVSYDTKKPLKGTFFCTVLKMKDTSGREVFVRVNKESLRKRLNISEKDFKQAVKQGTIGELIKTKRQEWLSEQPSSPPTAQQQQPQADQAGHGGVSHSEEAEHHAAPPTAVEQQPPAAAAPHVNVPPAAQPAEHPVRREEDQRMIVHPYQAIKNELEAKKAEEEATMKRAALGRGTDTAMQAVVVSEENRIRDAFAQQQTVERPLVSPEGLAGEGQSDKAARKKEPEPPTVSETAKEEPSATTKERPASVTDMGTRATGAHIRLLKGASNLAGRGLQKAGGLLARGAEAVRGGVQKTVETVGGAISGPVGKAADKIAEKLGDRFERQQLEAKNAEAAAEAQTAIESRLRARIIANIDELVESVSTKIELANLKIALMGVDGTTLSKQDFIKKYESALAVIEDSLNRAGKSNELSNERRLVHNFLDQLKK